VFEYTPLTQKEVKRTLSEQIRAKFAAKIKERKQYEERHELP
jgi:hypothetical protein